MIKIAKLYTELDDTDDTMECVMITDEIERLMSGQPMNTEEQTAMIAELETQIDLLQNEIFELRKGKDSQKDISDLMAQVAELKKIAKCERAQRLRDLVDYETDDTMMPDFYEDACRMLNREHPEVDWR
jgi:hypothetical protein